MPPGETGGIRPEIDAQECPCQSSPHAQRWSPEQPPGVGAAIAMHLARQGAKVVVTDVDSTGIDDVVQAIMAAGGDAAGTAQASPAGTTPPRPWNSRCRPTAAALRREQRRCWRDRPEALGGDQPRGVGAHGGDRPARCWPTDRPAP
ncbi:hypothetical protein QJS66_18175 [Kocuria rhizophila]|nr:hypothetical protein QJS66_18175 [Kocuria rhizophila]